MKASERMIFISLLTEALPEIEREIAKVDLKKFPRVRIVFEFEAPDKFALEIRKRRPWQ